MVRYDPGVENLITKLGNDTKLRFRESYTHAEFDATNYEVLKANNEINHMLNILWVVTLEDILDKLKVPNSVMRIIPKEDLACGWNGQCFEGWDDGAWLDFWISCIEEEGKMIFQIDYPATPCAGCRMCDGSFDECDRYLSGSCNAIP